MCSSNVIHKLSCPLPFNTYLLSSSAGLISYTIPTPDDFPILRSDTMYSDDTYDGAKGENFFDEGLGQLADGVIGSNNLEQVNIAT